MEKESGSSPDKKYKVVRSEGIQLGRFRIILDTIEEGEKEHPYSYIDQKASVCVLPFVRGRILLIRQYRHAVESYGLEIPGGGMDVGEGPREAAIRELEEETGYRIKELVMLAEYYPSPGSSNERAWLYMAECEDRPQETRLEPLEYIEKVFVTEDEMEELVMGGKIMHGMTLLSWFYYKARKGT